MSSNTAAKATTNATVAVPFGAVQPGRAHRHAPARRPRAAGKRRVPRVLVRRRRWSGRTSIKSAPTGACSRHPPPANDCCWRPESAADKVRTLTLVEDEDEFGRLLLLLGVDEPGLRDGLRWEAETTELPELGTVEIWELLNLTEDVHPIHLHLVNFQILDRQPIDVDAYLDSGEIITTGPAIQPEPFEEGWHDTVHANPGEITRIIAPFEGYTGRNVWHCHILEHEDHEMMRTFRVAEP